MSAYVELTLFGETLSTKQAVDPILAPDGLRLRVHEHVNGAVPLTRTSAPSSQSKSSRAFRTCFRVSQPRSMRAMRRSTEPRAS
jgi:hypothetical protein